MSSSHHDEPTQELRAGTGEPRTQPRTTAGGATAAPPTSHAHDHERETTMDTERTTRATTAGSAPTTGHTTARTEDDPAGTPVDGRDDATDADAAAGRDGAAASGPGLRVGTVVWGLVVAAVGVGLLALAWGAEFDVELAFIGLVAAAGVALLAGSVVAAVRRRER